MRLERSELHYLVAVIEFGGFNKAAGELGISQSAVSQAVAGLESKLNTLLVNRGRTPSLTRSGQRIYEYALSSLQSEQLALQEIDEIRRNALPPLSIAMNHFISQHFASDLLVQMLEGQSGLIAKTREMPSREIISAVLSGQFELGFGPFQTQMRAFQTHALMTIQHSMLISRQHPDFDAIQAGDAKALANTRLIAAYLDDPSDRPGGQRIRDYFKDVWQVSNAPLRSSLIKRGLGVGYLSRASQDDSDTDAKHQLVTVQHKRFPVLEREVGIYYQRDRLLSVTAENFIAVCEKYFVSR